jgi:hypothetical protein
MEYVKGMRRNLEAPLVSHDSGLSFPPQEFKKVFSKYWAVKYPRWRGDVVVFVGGLLAEGAPRGL